MTFKRPLHTGKRRGTLDEPGDVYIRIYRLEGGQIKSGQMTKSFRVADARVSEVAACIDKALFGGENDAASR